MSAPQKYRQRYLAFGSNEERSRGDLIRICIDINRKYELAPQIRLIFYDEDRGKFLIRCTQSQVDLVKERFGNEGGDDIDIIGISGTIRRARAKFFNPKKYSSKGSLGRFS